MKTISSIAAIWFACSIVLAQQGRIDPTFHVTFDRNVQAIAIQPDGRILIGGAFTNVNGVTSRALVRLHPDGRIDYSFRPLIKAQQYGGVSDIALLPDGRIVIYGAFTEVNGVVKKYFACLLPDGRLDESFLAAAYTPYSKMDVQTDGKIVFGYSERVTRLNTDGSFDTNFNIRLGRFAHCSAVRVQRDGKILFGGNFTVGVARANPDGTIDGSFYTAGADLGYEPWVLREMEDGCIFVGGDVIAKLAPNGRLANDFPLLYCNSQGVQTAVIRDGKVIVGGYPYTDWPKFLRLTSDGRLDTSFGTPDGGNQPIDCIAETPQGQLLVGGRFTTFGGQANSYLVRILMEKPVLSHSKSSDGKLMTMWPAAYTNFVLQAADGLPTTDWNTVSEVLLVVDGVCFITNKAVSGMKFFRLAMP